MSHFSLQQSAFLPSNHPLHCISSTNYYEVGFGSRLSTFWWRWKTNRWWSMNRFSGEIFTHGFLIVFKEKKWERKWWDDYLSPPAVIFIVCHVKLWQSNDVLELYFFLLKSVGIQLSSQEMNEKMMLCSFLFQRNSCFLKWKRIFVYLFTFFQIELTMMHRRLMSCIKQLEILSYFFIVETFGVFWANFLRKKCVCNSRLIGIVNNKPSLLRANGCILLHFLSPIHTKYFHVFVAFHTFLCK